MTIRTVLAPLTGGAVCETVAQAAARLARAFNAHLIGLHVRTDPATAVPYVADGLTADIIHELVASADRAGAQRAEEARKIFESIIAELGLRLDAPREPDKPSARWMERTGIVGETVGRMARVADITVVAKPDPKHDPLTAGLLDDVLTRSGRALMMAPPKLPERIVERVVVAWNGSTEAARAVSDALPLLKRAQEVSIVTVGDIHPERPDAEAIAEYLTYHGVKPQVLKMDLKDGGVGATLLEAATRARATLLVLGAYSHSRWRELVLGGVTRVVVDQADLPVVMSH
ncbi:MAG: universal stress protein [Alphaproteobacteria bacterium]|nr:MAG: universal stress protein [Alphaproteobacteria bacterium]